MTVHTGSQLPFSRQLSAMYCAARFTWLCGMQTEAQPYFMPSSQI